ncbi:MAG: ComEC/Rec2 family competence protein [Exilispira sp.]
MNLIKLSGTKLNINYSKIIFFFTSPLIFLGAFFAEKLLNNTFTLRQFYYIYTILLFLLFILVVFTYFLIKSDKSEILLTISFLLLIGIFAVSYRYSCGDLSYNYSILSQYINKFPYFFLQTTDFSQDYEQYTRIKAYIIGFSDLKKIEKTKILVYFYSDNISEISSGSIYLFETEKLKKFATINYLEEKSTISLSRIDAKYKIKDGNFWGKIRIKIRKILFNRIIQYYDRWNAGNIYAILTGSRQFIFQPLLKIFQNTGTSHLFALSGMHLSILLLIVGIFTSSYIVLILFSFLYLAFAGWQISFLRAFYSLLLAIIMKKYNIKPDFEKIIALITILVFISEPQNLLSISFLLSLTAIAALLATSIIFIFVKKQKSKNIFVNYILIPFTGSFQIFIFQLPLISGFFGKINLLTPLINLIAIPLFSFAIYFAIPSILFNPFLIFSNIAKGFFNSLYIFLLYISRFQKFILDIKIDIKISYIILFFIYSIYIILIERINYKKDNCKK